MTSELRPVAVVSSTASDAHTWNLVYLQLLLEELGFAVTNLGACVPDELVVRECRRLDPDVVVLSTVNGHGHTDGLRLAPRLRAALAGAALVIGGKLGVDGTRGVAAEAELRAAGFDRVFGDGDIAAFRRYLAALPVRVAS
ncbi:MULTISPECIES: cobalamin-dependent protein [unclassified Amycolatopsis]|uniref:cobalamin B12-binding domain-containing protein n=1 Tax=unclassified Amycolatopsis TaxID=2618356 RepID=UPI001FF14453|nr:cobalamin-dependent protein [Amycolatopsis sp. FBCC-B4732]UOX91003.1 cobalamin-dependent protein [Amycolatopsis sp. FBCC-B4732]